MRNIDRFEDHAQPIIVTGVPRSGVSIIASLLRAFEAWPGDGEIRGRESYNNEVRNRIVRPFFRGIRSNLIGRGNTLLTTDQCRDVKDTVAPVWRRRILHLIHGKGYAGGPWLYWGADACLAWPIWNEAFPGAHWVIVRRETDAIVNACIMTKYVRDVVSDIPEWVDSYLTQIDRLQTGTESSRECWPGSVYSGKLDTARTLVTRLGMNWNDDTANDALSPALWASGVFSTVSTKGGTS